MLATQQENKVYYSSGIDECQCLRCDETPAKNRQMHADYIDEES